jgi:hypothetical protein
MSTKDVKTFPFQTHQIARVQNPGYYRYYRIQGVYKGDFMQLFNLGMWTKSPGILPKFHGYPQLVPKQIPANNGIETVTSCYDAYQKGHLTSSKFVDINLNGEKMLKVWCELGQGFIWTLVRSYSTSYGENAALFVDQKHLEKQGTDLTEALLKDKFSLSLENTLSIKSEATHWMVTLGSKVKDSNTYIRGRNDEFDIMLEEHGESSCQTRHFYLLCKY